jgi:hypothetical protein
MGAAWNFTVAPRVTYFLGGYSWAKGAFLGKGRDNAGLHTKAASTLNALLDEEVRLTS